MAKPMSAPVPNSRGRLGLNGRCGTRAGSSTRNCSPIWPDSSLADILDSSLFDSRLA